MADHMKGSQRLTVDSRRPAMSVPQSKPLAVLLLPARNRAAAIQPETDSAA